MYPVLPQLHWRIPLLLSPWLPPGHRWTHLHRYRGERRGREGERPGEREKEKETKMVFDCVQVGFLSLCILLPGWLNPQMRWEKQNDINTRAEKSAETDIRQSCSCSGSPLVSSLNKNGCPFSPNSIFTTPMCS